MKIGILGTGVVGKTLASKFIELGHDVCLGSRSHGNESALDWVSEQSERATAGTFDEAAAFGEVVINATRGDASLDAIRSIAEPNLSGKVLVDVANPLDFSQGMPPRLSVGNDDSLGEQIQREFPSARVVKTLNTVSAHVMVAPDKLPEKTSIFVCGNDDDAKSQVSSLLQSLGWSPESIEDLGDITAARGVEMYLPLWLRLLTTSGSFEFNIRVVRPG